LIVIGVRFEPAINEFVYNFSREIRKVASDLFLSPPRPVLAPIELRESQVITVCEALQAQLGVLERELNQAKQQTIEHCPTAQELPIKTFIREDNGKTAVPSPRFGHNEFVYLVETAESVGRLEGYRIGGLEWDTTLNEWVYSFTIHPRPGKNMTVGDRGDMTFSYVVKYSETELGRLCEVLPLVVSFLERAVARTTLRLQAYCPEVLSSV
jgi:hypothetical protein